ncbi:MAG: 3-keto-disaccharide hydrolase, partial [Limisphaerales bacterium]
MIKNLMIVFFAVIAGGLSAEAGQKLKPIFNGKNLNGWEAPKGNAEAGWYKAEEGVLKIHSGPKKKGSILWSKKQYRDFVMEFEFRFGKGVVDTGIHIRNGKEQIQLGISGSLKRDMTGSPYIAGKGYPVEAEGVMDLLKAKEWNKMKIKAVGGQYTVWLQGKQVMTYKSDTAIEEGPIGIQL